jgi:hypothetical protein
VQRPLLVGSVFERRGEDPFGGAFRLLGAELATRKTEKAAAHGFSSSNFRWRLSDTSSGSRASTLLSSGSMGSPERDFHSWKERPY